MTLITFQGLVTSWQSDMIIWGRGGSEKQSSRGRRVAWFELSSPHISVCVTGSTRKRRSGCGCLLSWGGRLALTTGLWGCNASSRSLRTREAGCLREKREMLQKRNKQACGLIHIRPTASVRMVIVGSWTLKHSGGSDLQNQASVCC